MCEDINKKLSEGIFEKEGVCRDHILFRNLFIWMEQLLPNPGKDIIGGNCKIMCFHSSPPSPTHPAFIGQLL
jgi:hypothetical protein